MKTLLSVLIVMTACSRVNVAEQTNYAEQSKMRHGLVPAEVPLKKLKPISSLIKDAQLQRGKELFNRDCASCHGENGEGQGPLAAQQEQRPANLRKTVSEVEHFEFYLSVSQWEGSMPGWKSPYTAEDREAIALYLKTFR